MGAGMGRRPRVRPAVHRTAVLPGRRRRRSRSTTCGKSFDRHLRDYAIALRTDPDTGGQARDRPRSTCWNSPTCGSGCLALWAYVEAGNPVWSRRSELGPAPPRWSRSPCRSAPRCATTRRCRARSTGGCSAWSATCSPATPTTSPSSSPATVARWDAAETSRRLELQVGRDLQFIRVNGTVVGALVGVIIYAVSQIALRLGGHAARRAAPRSRPGRRRACGRPPTPPGREEVLRVADQRPGRAPRRPATRRPRAPVRVHRTA